MISRRMLPPIAVSLALLTFVSQSRCEVIGVYDAQKLVVERERLEARTRELWKKMFEGLLTQDEKAALKKARLSFPTLSADGSRLNFYADSTQGVVHLPIHSLLYLEDACTAYAWLHRNGFSPITINE